MAAARAGHVDLCGQVQDNAVAAVVLRHYSDAGDFDLRGAGHAEEVGVGLEADKAGVDLVLDVGPQELNAVGAESAGVWPGTPCSFNNFIWPGITTISGHTLDGEFDNLAVFPSGKQTAGEIQRA